MANFPAFMKHPANRIVSASQHTADIEGYAFDGVDGVWEWFQDWYHDSYNGVPTDGSAWLSGGEQKYRVIRGGAWGSHSAHLRSASRYRDTPNHRDDGLGFRIVAVV